MKKIYDKGITPELLSRMKTKAYELSKKPNTFYADQFGSINFLKGYIPIGKEIKNRLENIDVFWASVGSGGAIMGTWNGLNSHN